MVVRIIVKCNRQFRTDGDEKRWSNSHTITPQKVDEGVEQGGGGGVRGGARVSQMGSWNVMST